jgi:hypothetical protein
LKRAYGILVIGSTEAHYTPSKVYQAVQSRRPVLALLHEASSAVEVLERSGAGSAVTLSENALPTPERIADTIERFVNAEYRPDDVRWDAFEAYSARESARLMARALDEALKRFDLRRATNMSAA